MSNDRQETPGISDPLKGRRARPPLDGIRRTRRILSAVRKSVRSLRDIGLGPGWAKSSDDRRSNRVTRDDEVMDAVAHELRTPLTTIRSVTEILQDNPDLTDEQRDRFIAMLAEESDRLHCTIDQMLRSSTPGRDRLCIDTADIVRRPLTA